ncbi:MAG: nuclear transport factor 2 family protein [Bacteroidota bacterium]
MKTILTILITFTALPFSFAQNKDIAILKQLNKDWIHSFVTRDTAMMNRIYAEDMALVSPGGRVFHKKKLLLNLLSPGQEYLSSKVDTVTVRLLGSVGLVSAEATAVAKANGKVSTVRTCYLDVYEKRKGRWYAVASQVTLLSEK